jgi:hypothetical protein
MPASEQLRDPPGSLSLLLLGLGTPSSLRTVLALRTAVPASASRLEFASPVAPNRAILVNDPG